jgi:hypothetical protein
MSVMDWTAIRGARLVAPPAASLVLQRVGQGGRRRWSAARARRGCRGPGARRGAGRRWSCRCRPSPRPRRAAVVALDELALRRVQEDRPLLPRVLERALQLLDVGEHAEAALGVRVLERVGVPAAATGRCHRGFTPTPDRAAPRRPPAGRCSASSSRVSSVACAHVVQPLRRDAVAAGARRRRTLSNRASGGRAGGTAPRTWTGSPRPLADLHELRGAGLRVRLQLAPLGPGVGGVVVVDVAEQQARAVRWTIRRMSRLTRTDQKFGSFALVELVELHPGIGGVELEVEGRGLDRLLLLAGELWRGCR